MQQHAAGGAERLHQGAPLLLPDVPLRLQDHAQDHQARKAAEEAGGRRAGRRGGLEERAEDAEHPACNGSEAYFMEVQTRSADEPATLFYKCVACGHRWKEG